MTPVQAKKTSPLSEPVGFEEARSARILICARQYLRKQDNHGQHDRAMSVDADGPEGKIYGLIETYFNSQREKWDRVGPVIDEYLGRQPDRILDVGSSIGNASIALCRRYPLAEVVGFEFEPEAVDLARAMVQGRERCHFVNEPIEKLRGEDGLFDFIHCSNVLEHVGDPKAVVGRLAAALSPGGVMLISGPNYLFPWEHHVHCWMLPGGPRALVKWLLKRRGDPNPAFVDHLRLNVNTVSMKHWLRLAGNVDCRDLSHAKVDEVLHGESDGLFAPRLVARIKKLRLNRLLSAIARLLPLTPSMTLLVKKRTLPS